MAELSGGAPSMGRSDQREDLLSERRQYRKFTAQQKTELVLTALKGSKSIAELARGRGRENDRLARTLGRKTIPQRSAREKVL